jgi:hypothetical protein
VTPANYAARQFTFSVTAPTIALSTTTVAAGGTVTATVANGPGNTRDWVGLYPTGTSSSTSNRLAYQYLNGLQTPPTNGTSGGTLTFGLPTAGSYELRLFVNNSLTVLATSAAIMVAASARRRTRRR